MRIGVGIGLAFGRRQGFDFGLNAGNLVTSPDDLSSGAWTKSGATVVADQAPAPTGAVAMDLLVPSTVSGAHLAYSNTFGFSTPLAISFYAKAAGYSKIAFRESATTGAYASYDLAGGTVLDSGNAGSFTVSNLGISAVGNGVFRCSLRLTPAGSASANVGLYVLPTSYTAGQPNDVGWLGDGSSGVLLWRVQAHT